MAQQKLLQTEHSILSLNQMSDVYDLVSDIVENLDELAISELLSGGIKDTDHLIAILIDEAAQVVATKNPAETAELNYLDTFAKEVEETLRVKSLNYFILTVLPDFILGWHNIEWSNLIQINRFLCVLAARDHGKTTIAGTKVVMHDGSIKNVENIKVGDLLMGTDGTPRKVLNTHVVYDVAYRIEQTNNGGEDYVVNSKHLLHLEQDDVVWKKNRYIKTGEKRRINITAPEYLRLPKITQKNTFGVRVNGWDLPEKTLPVSPYIFGTWLGDGHSHEFTLTTKDDAILREWNDYFDDVRKIPSSVCSYSAHGKKASRTLLKEMNVFKNKHIPQIYMTASREQRMQLLAGIIDTDGNYEKNNNRYVLAFKRDTLANDVRQLAWSLGFKSRVRQQKIKLSYNGNDYVRDEVIITGDIWNIPVKIARKKAKKRNRNHDIFRHRIKVSHVGKDTFYGFEVDKDNLYIHRDGTIIHNSYHFSFAYPLWQMYRYRRRQRGKYVPKELQMAREGLLITNEFNLARHFLAMIKEEIANNPILHERLMPESKREGWGKEKIICKNGASLAIKSAGSKIRGYHPTYIILDDFLNESSLYSQEQRDKYQNVFTGVILPALSPGGQMLVVGTPFFEKDLYAYLKSTGEFPVFEYPAIFPDGQLLFPQRHSFKSLMSKRNILGSLVFSREILVKPVSDMATIFPYSILRNAIKGQDSVDVITNIDNSERKFTKIVVGADFAISSNIAADYTVFTILGVDDLGNYHILNTWRKRGANYSQQIAALKKINYDFRPDVIYAEDNGMQEIFIQMMQDANLPVVGKTTNTINKKSLYKGIPSLAVLFETFRIKFPYGTQRAKDLTDLYFAELNSITYIQDTGKLESTSQHDDTSMSLWNAVRAAKGTVDDFDFSFL